MRSWTAEEATHCASCLSCPDSRSCAVSTGEAGLGSDTHAVEINAYQMEESINKATAAWKSLPTEHRIILVKVYKEQGSG